MGIVDGVWLIDAYGGAAIISPTEYFGVKQASASLIPPISENPVAGKPPKPADKVATARWMAHRLDWGVLSTTSSRSEGTKPGDAFGNPYSFADAGKGTPYFYGSMLDATMIGLSKQTKASLALSEASLTGHDAQEACKIGEAYGDPENPPCARLVLSGNVVKLEVNSTEEKEARAALFQRHPSFSKFPDDHHFFVSKLEVTGVWLISEYGGAAIIPPDQYLGYSMG